MGALGTCPDCGGARAASDRFCGSCGLDFTVPAAAPAAARAGLDKTRFTAPTGVAAAGAPASPAEPAPAPSRFARTMLGVSPAELGIHPAGHAAEKKRSGPPAAVASVPEPSAVLSAKKTMLGVMPVPADAPHASAPDAPARTPPGKLLTNVDPLARTAEPDFATKATMVGNLNEIARGMAPPAAPAPATGPAKLGGLVEPTKRTMLGVVPMPASAPPSNEPPVPPAASVGDRATPFGSAAEPVRSGSMAEPTKLTEEPSRPSVLDRRVPLSFSRPQGGPRESRPSQEGASGRSRSVWPLAWVAAGLALLGVALGAALLFRTPDLRVRVVEVEGQEMLEIEAPGSAPGSKVRFAGVEQPLAAGRGRFALEASTLTVGDNPLTIDLVEPDGDLRSSTVSVFVPFRVRTDIAALAADPPAVEVIFDAAPGASVMLEGEHMELDDHGHATRRFVVPPQEGATYEVAYRYRVEANKSVTDASIKLELPVTSLRVDRPGVDAVTDQSTLEIAGAVEAGAIVQLSGQLLPISEGRFLYRASLAAEGEYSFELLAKAPGKAPRSARVHARRVNDMALAAASFVPDPLLNYARLAQNPTIYVGQKVAFDGRVYNVEVEGGRSILQLLVVDCPGAARCPLWVAYSQATDATVDTWVRVLGTVAGQQEFHSQQGKTEVVPSVHAQYVLRLVR